MYDDQFQISRYFRFGGGMTTLTLSCNPRRALMAALALISSDENGKQKASLGAVSGKLVLAPHRRIAMAFDTFVYNEFTRMIPLLTPK
ncbi:unnamed protein product [Cylicostephanus goldi]|uniref:Uncharacterized protein n=1 Tax=Cylicostephanus goldi TaxID=71465 RepID=A0A3P7NPZ0_CYLGO|nr:unnamed protein product [Cylicostephanus goldi]